MTLSMRRLAYAAAWCAALALNAFPSGTATWELNSYADFIRGRFNGLSLSREGRLSLSPKVDTLFTSDQPVIWALAQTPDGAIYAATGHRGRLYKIDGPGKSTLLWTAPEPEIFALAVDRSSVDRSSVDRSSVNRSSVNRSGAVFAATSPDGKVYRIENGKATVYFAPKARYIWSLAVDAK